LAFIVRINFVSMQFSAASSCCCLWGPNKNYFRVRIYCCDANRTKTNKL